jgi:hypothetical protein
MTAPRVLALVLPLLVLALGAWGLQRDGNVSGKALGFERRLAASRPEVVVLGSSLARTDVDVHALAEGLGVPAGRVEVLTLPNATAPHWYAILKNRVLTQPEPPRVVLVVGALTTMITPELLRDVNVERLMNQLTDDEPVIAAKVLHTESAAVFSWWFLRERAGAARDGAVRMWRDSVLAVLFAARGRLADGGALAEMVNERVFADEAMDYALHRPGSTGLFGGGVEALDLSGVDVARDSLIPDLAALAREAGVALVFVRTPFPPSNQDNDLVPPEVEAAAIAAMEAGGAAWLDLSRVALRESDYQDMRHMSREGAVVFTQALAAELVARGLGEGGPGPAAQPARVARSDGGPVGDGPVDLPAGASLTVSWDDAWSGDALQFEVRAVVRGSATLWVGDTATPLRGHGELAWAAWAGAAPTGPWSVRVVADGDAEVLAVGVGRGARGRAVVGDAAWLRPASVRLVGGKAEDVAVAPSFAGPAPAPAAGVGARRAGPGIGAFALPGLAALSDASDVNAGVMTHACSPLRVTEDGAVLERVHEPCLDVGRLRGGRVCHAGNSLYFSATDGSQPGDNGAVYGLTLAEDRRCTRLLQDNTTPLRDLLWVYPGDALTLALPPERLAAFRAGANRLELAWSAPVLEAADALQARLEVDGAAVAEVTLRGAEGRLTVPLDPPVGSGEVRLVVTSSGARTYWLLHAALLTEAFDAAADGASAAPIADATRAAADRVVRVGEAPAVEAPKATRDLPQDLVEVQLYPLWPVSNPQLTARGHGPWSPLRGEVDGQTLRPTVAKRALRQRCADCFLHEGKVATLPRPPSPVRWHLDEAVPQGAVGVWWVYPGTSLRWEHDAPWAGASLRVEVTVDVLSSGQKASTAPVLRVGGRQVELVANGERWTGAVALASAGAGGWAVEVGSPVGGPFVLVERVVVEDADGARVIAEAGE